MNKQEREKARLPIGLTVKVRGCPGLGTGTVKAHVTERRFVDGRRIPLVDHLEVDVELEWLDEGRPIKVTETFSSAQVVPVK